MISAGKSIWVDLYLRIGVFRHGRFLDKNKQMDINIEFIIFFIKKYKP